MTTLSYHTKPTTTIEQQKPTINKIEEEKKTEKKKCYFERLTNFNIFKENSVFRYMKTSCDFVVFRPNDSSSILE